MKPWPTTPAPAAQTQSKSIALAVVVLSLVYLLTHGGNLARELTNEEGYFTIPGRNLFETGRYDAYFGEDLLGGSSSHNPFHKPPGVSLVLAACSYLSADGVAGARLAPLCAGLFAVLLPLLLTRRWVPSVVVMAAPFFYAGSSHMQTDPVVGLLGYGLCLGWWQGVWRQQPRLSWLVAGAVVLWTGKLEIAIIAATASAFACLLLLAGPGGRARFCCAARDLAIGHGIGALVFVLLTWSLGCTAGYGFIGSVGHVIGTIVRIGGTLDGDHRAALWSHVGDFDGWSLLALLGLPLLLGILVNARDGALWTCALFGALPFAVYGAAGYVGDGYPRYFLIGFEALAVGAGQALAAVEQRFGRRAHALASAAMLAAGLGLCTGPSLAMMRAPGSITVARGTTGWRDAARLADQLAPAGTWFAGPERCYWYARGRPWLIFDSFDTRPELRTLSLSFVAKVGAAIVPRQALDHPLVYSETTLLPALLASGNWDRFLLHDVAVFVRRP